MPSRHTVKQKFHKLYPHLKLGGGLNCCYLTKGGASGGYLNGVLSRVGGNALNLNTGLKAYYKLENATDTLGVNNLTNNNVVTFVAGKVSNAANFVAASSQSLSHIDTVSLRSGGPFTVACWAQLTTKAADACMVGKYASATSSTHEFVLWYRQSTDRFRVNAAASGGADDSVEAVTFGSPSTGVWYFLVLTYDGSTISLSVNNGTADTTAHASQNAGSSPFELGHCDQLTGTGFLNGLLDEVGYWNYALTAAQISYLYNGGTGRTYPFSSGV